mgnify:CR=1 FL=1
MVSLAEKSLTGEPDAANPPVRFGGRGGVPTAIPTPIGTDNFEMHGACLVRYSVLPNGPDAL